MSSNNDSDDSASTAGSDVVCTKCESVLGIHDTNASGHRLWKWAIDITSTPSKRAPDAPSTLQTYTTEKWISARLLFLIENLGIRKFHVYPSSASQSSQVINTETRKEEGASKEKDSIQDTEPEGSKVSTRDGELGRAGLLLWLFTPDLYFSSSVSTKRRRDPTRAVKVFWQPKPYVAKKLGDREEVGVEEVEMPKPLYEDLERALEGSGKLLPANARVFQGWRVGLLGRFDVGEV